MVCLSCHVISRSPLCRACTATLRVAPDRLLPGGILVVAAFRHEGAARALVHQLKYQGSVHFARMAADLVTNRVPELPLMPIPRAWSRRIKYGIDPALAIAREISALTGQPVVQGLRAPLHSRRRAGGDHHREVASFRRKTVIPRHVILVDDVVTSGRTIVAAAQAVGVEQVALAVAANAAPQVTSLRLATQMNRGRG